MNNCKGGTNEDCADGTGESILIFSTSVKKILKLSRPMDPAYWR